MHGARVGYGFNDLEPDDLVAAWWPRVRLALPSLGALAVVCAGFAVVWSSELSAEDAVAALSLLALMVLAHLFPLRVAERTTMTLDAGVIFATVLLFDPPTAILIAGGGCLLAQTLRRRPARRLWAGVGQTVLQTSAGGAVLALGSWDYDSREFARVDQLVLAASAAASIYLVHLVAVAGAAARQSKLSLTQAARRFVDSVSSADLAQFALGLLAAVVASVDPWLLALFVLPGIAVFHSSRRQIATRRQTVVAVEALADIIDQRDPYTANHSQRVAAHARTIATLLGLAPGEIDLVERAARVHDIGKIVLDRQLLDKEGSLDDEDWAQLRGHPGVGAAILGRFPEFAPTTEYVRFHHERVDGRGYPNAIPGEHIPIGARIIAVADALDAMTTARPYRRAVPVDLALAEFRRKKGAQWDADVVDVMLAAVADGRIDLPGYYPAQATTPAQANLAFAPRPALTGR